MTRDEMAEPIKAGDKLVMTFPGFAGRLQNEVAVVDRVTASGIVNVRGLALNQDLSVRGKSSRSRFGPGVSFKRCTPEMEASINQENRDKAERQMLADHMHDAEWGAVDLGTLRQVRLLVRKAGGFKHLEGDSQ
jgi:hypothetical protein